MKVYATYNIKGGVGKTSTAVNLAYLAAASGRRTLLWDLDPQGAATYLFRVKPRVKGGGRGLVSGKRPVDDAVKATDFDNLDLLPADFSYRNMDLELDDAKKRTRRLDQLLSGVADDYDVVFLDCPPSVSLVSENVLRAADVLLVPLIPATLSLRTYAQLTRFVADAPRPRPRGRGLLLDGRPAQAAAPRGHRRHPARPRPDRRHRHPVDGTHRADGRAARAGPRLRTDQQGSQVLRAAVGGGPRWLVSVRAARRRLSPMRGEVGCGLGRQDLGSGWSSAVWAVGVILRCAFTDSRRSTKLLRARPQWPRRKG